MSREILGFFFGGGAYTGFEKPRGQVNLDGVRGIECLSFVKGRNRFPDVFTSDIAIDLGSPRADD